MSLKLFISQTLREFTEVIFLHLATTAVVVTAVALVLAPLWAPLGVCYYLSLNSWTAFWAFMSGAMFFLFLQFAAAKAARMEPCASILGKLLNRLG